MRYEDATVSVDGDGITIKRYGTFGSQRTIPFDDITAVTASRLGSLGKWRLVGAGPGGGSRNWYGWDRDRQRKRRIHSTSTDSGDPLSHRTIPRRSAQRCRRPSTFVDTDAGSPPDAITHPQHQSGTQALPASQSQETGLSTARTPIIQSGR